MPPLHPRERLTPELAAALVNAALVLLIPFAWIGFVVLRGTPGNTIVARVSPLPMFILRRAMEFGILLTPFALLATVAGWRTWVHAIRVRRGNGRGWRGVLEGGALGASIALVLLAPASSLQPTAAPPYLIFYGGASAVLGMVAGFILRLTALLTLRLTLRRAT